MVSDFLHLVFADPILCLVIASQDISDSVAVRVVSEAEMEKIYEEKVGPSPIALVVSL
jgi:hypothetical protein